MKKKKGFTLAEVLITLTIIGVVAAITVPTLIQRTNKQEYVSALQKAYSTLSQATNMIIAENGSPKCSEGGWACDGPSLHDMYLKYISTAKDCSKIAGGKGCMTQYGRVRGFDGGDYGSGWDQSASHWRPIVLADGTQAVFLGSDNTHGSGSGFTTCTNNFHDSIYQACAAIAVDINGERKPNLMGRDLFWFVLTEKGLYPNSTNPDKCTSGDALSCAGKVLREGAMNY